MLVFEAVFIHADALQRMEGEGRRSLTRGMALVRRNAPSVTDRSSHVLSDVTIYTCVYKFVLPLFWMIFFLESDRKKGRFFIGIKFARVENDGASNTGEERDGDGFRPITVSLLLARSSFSLSLFLLSPLLLRSRRFVNESFVRKKSFGSIG